MKVMITGSREFNNIDKVRKVLDRYNITHLILGGARGVDEEARLYALDNNIPYTIIKPDWSLGKHAGMLRNAEMAKQAEVIIAFWNGKSTGTKHAIGLADELNLPISIYLDKELLSSPHMIGLDGYKVCNLKKGNDLGIKINDTFEEITYKLNKYTHVEIIKKLLGSVVIAPGIMTDKHGLGALHKYMNYRGIEFIHLVRGKRIDPYNSTIFDIALSYGYSRLYAMLLDNRIPKERWFEVKDILTPNLFQFSLLFPDDSEIYKGIDLINKHINGNIVLVTDSDADGVNSAAIGEIYFSEYLNKEINVIVNERRFGNGVNDEMIKRILKMHKDTPVDLVITADHGSSDDPRYKILKEHGIDILVTDHHIPPKGQRPEYCDVFINPQYKDSKLPDYISGCAVLYALLINHRKQSDAIEDLTCARLIPYVGITTLADQMDLSRPLNRFLVKEGIYLQNEIQHPVWLAYSNSDTLDFQWDDWELSRGLVPRINAGNRLGEAFRSYKYLISKSIHDAEENLNYITGLNEQRRSMQRKYTQEVKDNLIEYKNVATAKVSGGLGVIGVLAGNQADKLGKPVFVFAEHDGVLKGSARNPASNLSLEESMRLLGDKKHYVLKSGGHKGAGGIEIKDGFLKQFSKDYSELVEHLTNGILDTQKEYDMKLPIFKITKYLYNELNRLGPYGRGFRIPQFLVKGIVEKIFINKNKTYVSLTLRDDGVSIECYSFDANRYRDVTVGDVIEVIASIEKKKETIQLFI